MPGGSLKWTESYAGRLEDHETKALSLETESLVVKSATVSQPPKLKNKQWRERK